MLNQFTCRKHGRTTYQHANVKRKVAWRGPPQSVAIEEMTQGTTPGEQIEGSSLFQRPQIPMNDGPFNLSLSESSRAASSEGSTLQSTLMALPARDVPPMSPIHSRKRMLPGSMPIGSPRPDLAGFIASPVKRPCFGTPQKCPPTPTGKTPPASPLLFGTEVLRRFQSIDSMGWRDVSDSRFEELGELGEGDYGKVLSVRDKKTGVLYALKKWKKPSKGINERCIVLRKMDIVREVSRSCPFILSHVVFWQEGGHYRLLTELCQKETLHEAVVNQAEGMSYTRIKKYAWQLATALQVLHTRTFAHMDVKLSNIYLTEQDDIRLGDFGMATEIGSGDVQEGDSRYMAPELLSDAPASVAADIFSWGITCYELLSRENLPTQGERWQALRNTEHLRGILAGLNKVETSFLELIAAAMHTDPLQRPSAQEIVESAVFNDIKDKRTVHRQLLML